MTKNPPNYLGKDGRALWRAMMRQADEQDWNYEIQDLSYLADACWIEDEISRLRSELEDAPRITKGSMKQDVANPLISEIRQLVGAKTALLKHLAIPDELPERDEKPMTRSQAGRLAADKRWRMYG